VPLARPVQAGASDIDPRATASDRTFHYGRNPERPSLWIPIIQAATTAAEGNTDHLQGYP